MIQKYVFPFKEGAFFLETKEKILTHVYSGEVIASTRFTSAEMSVIKLLFSRHPQYVEYVDMLSICFKLDREISVTLLLEAQENNSTHQGVVHHMISDVSRTRKKLAKFGIAIRTIAGKQYFLDMQRYEINKWIRMKND